MCGITGYVWEAGARPVNVVEFDRMTDLLTHRGPDGRGVHRIDRDDGSGVALGHRRLSIIDLGGGTQPMCNEDGTVWITFNGEIYNYLELRPQLENAGHRFRTNSDTETVVHLYEEYGDDFVDHLRGMFAISIWDERNRRMVLVRDRMGQKPLVYHHDGRRLVFASELKSILAVSDVPKEIRSAAIDEYLLYGYIPHPGTAYKNIHKLPPAHMAVYKNGKIKLHRYWNPDVNPLESMNSDSILEELNQVVDDAVRLRMRSDVPLGAFLSGGIDSTIIAGVMQRHAVNPTKTYTIGFPVDGFDESSFAAQAARHLGTEHHNMEVSPNSVDLIEKLVWHFDEPFADSSAIPTFLVSQLTRQHVKVALTGDGADELFCGYDRYKTVDRLGSFDRLPNSVRRLLTGPWADWIPNGSQSSLQSRLRHRLQILRLPPERRYASWMTSFPYNFRQELFNQDFLATVELNQSTQFLEQLVLQNESMRPGLRAMRVDLQSYLPCDLLAKVDITSMANSLECRSPFMDHHVVELAMRIPFRLLSQRRKVKPSLTSTFSELIPGDLKTRPKMGFMIPLDDWFRNDLKEFSHDLLLSSGAFCHTFFSPAALGNLLADHHSGICHNGARIWSLLFLEVWGRGIGQCSA